MAGLRAIWALAVFFLAAPALAMNPCGPGWPDPMRDLVFDMIDQDGAPVAYTYRKLDSGNILEISQASEHGGVEYFETLGGVLEVAFHVQYPGNSEPSAPAQYRYDFDVVLPPQTGQLYQGHQFDVSDPSAPSVPVKVTVGKSGARQIGSCDFQATDMEVAYYLDSPVVVRLTYLHELEFAIVRGFVEFGAYMLYEPVALRVE